MHYDVFNGDADGIIALVQMRLAEPKTSTLITGVKRDIQLLKQVVAKGDATSVTVLDISMEKNLSELNGLLGDDIPVFYCDHHRTGDVPDSVKLSALINLDAEVCTSLLINGYLDGQFATWAVAAAFGDNLNHSAEQLANELGLSSDDTAFLKELGMLINYNGYGAGIDDLHMAPADLFQQLLAYSCPLQLRDDTTSPYYRLKKGYEKDYQYVTQLTPIHQDNVACVYELPCDAWARRISGVFGNELANSSPDLAHGVLTLNASGQDYTVSVRAPLTNRTGADEVCSSFATGGGRRAAAGINALPCDEKQEFIQRLTAFYSQ
ncbi:DHH family phosphoesterase [Vibrio sp.]|nr:DHH family phosphoesterase [Vibrio sp.]